MLGDGIRRDFATISDEERNLFISTIRTLDDATSSFVYGSNTGHEGADGAGNITYWDMQEQIHKDAHVHGVDVHAGPAFIPWHRDLINHLEQLLRKIDPRLSLHYWDWTTDPRVAAGDRVSLFTSTFMGSSSGDAGIPFQDFESTEPGHSFMWRNVGPGAPGLTSDASILSEANFTAFSSALQGAHDTAHGYIGGSLGNSHFSFHDPFVFLLHSNMDRLWTMWQRSPHHQDRLNPATAYGTILSDLGLPATYYQVEVEPWAGATTDLNPWKDNLGSAQEHVTYLDPSIILPPSYDTAPHSSYIITNRDTYSTSEVGVTPNYPSAIYVVYDGFEPKDFGFPATPVFPTFTFTSGVTTLSTLSATNPVFSLEDPSSGAVDVPQRVTIAFDIQFSGTGEFPTTAGAALPVDVKVVFNYNVDTGTGGAVIPVTDIATTRFTLVNQPNPYMVDVAGSNPYWLSTDIRVFQTIAGQVTGAVTHGPDTDPSAPFTFVQGVVANFNNAILFPEGPAHPFRLLPDDEGASVLELSRSVSGHRVYNYAVAKVRYLAPSTVDATAVRVYFRVFSTLVSALDYDHTSGPTGNYRRAGDGSTSIPLLGIQGGEIASIPFFAAPRVDTSLVAMNMQTDDAATNTRTIAGTGTEQTAYFGCWLDINLSNTDPQGPQFPLHPLNDGAFSAGSRQTIQTLMRGAHHCMTAEIFFFPTGVTVDPIPPNATPNSSDRIAQRNLAIVESGNPGWPDTHTIQHTFMVKPSPVQDIETFLSTAEPVLQGAGPQADEIAPQTVDTFPSGPDELMVRWNSLPRDTRVTFHFPEVAADEILALAALRQHPTVLKKVDENTFECRVADIAYIPLPGGRKGNLAGLLSLTLPDGVRTGQVYKFNVQQYSGVSRKMLGAFQITIPVKDEPDILRGELRKLSVLRHVQQTIPAGDRWHGIFVRYLDEISRRVRGMGGDPDQVTASPDGGEAAGPPVVRIETPETTTLQRQVRLMAIASDPSGSALKFQWSADRSVAKIHGNTPVVDFQLAQGPGPYVFTVTVTNDAGLSATASITINFVGR
jgi:Common central domain of tyrosinase